MTAITPVNVGTSPNDNTGDLGRDGFIKINTNINNLNTDKLEAADIANKQDILAEGAFVDGDKTNLDNQSGTNTGDQDLSTLMDKVTYDPQNINADAFDADNQTIGVINTTLSIQEKKELLSGLSSGLRSGGVITVNATNPNNIDISAGEGIVIDNTDPLNPIVTNVSWTAEIDVVLTNIGSQPVTNLYFDKTGTLQQGTLVGINSTRRQNVLVGIAQHIFSANLESVNNISAQSYDTYVNLDELSSTLGRIKSTTFSTTGLNVNLSAGTTFGIGDNKNSQNPNVMTYTAQSAVLFTPSYQDGTGGWTYGTPTTTIPVTQWDDGSGTLATLQTNSKASVPLLFWDPLSNRFFFQYGQFEYNNIDIAKSEFLTDTQEINPLLGSVIFLGVMGSDKDATSVGFIQNSDKLGQLGLGGGSGASATDLQSSYNVSLPSAEIETNVTNGAVSLKGGTGTDTDNVLEIKNNAGTSTATIQANGTPTKTTDLITKSYADANYAGGGAVDSVNTKTGVVVLDKTDIGLDNVDNTSDVNKPVSTAQQTEIDTKLDTTGTAADSTKVGGITITGTPTVGQIATATSGTAATWQTPAAGGGGGFLREVDIAGTQILNTILFEGAIGKATTLSAGYITLLTAPTGSSFVISVSKSTDSGATYGTAETVTLTATNKYIKGTLTGAYAEGDFVKAEITTVGSTIAGQNLLFSVTGS